ncbi:hypothetical protein [Neolewinella persica]|uniref:hypothetical protein n=1 Tax=Neolewinella persica TaxID=70998 RepID=UPI00036D7D28|nr:hypothetical protein [Neolewinella persica]
MLERTEFLAVAKQVTGIKNIFDQRIFFEEIRSFCGPGFLKNLSPYLRERELLSWCVTKWLPQVPFAALRLLTQGEQA